MKVSILTLRFSDVEFQPRDIPKLRGWFAYRFPEYHQLHNHMQGGGFSYKYPVIQYRIIENNPALLAIHEGIEIVKNLFFETDEIQIDHILYTSKEKELNIQEYDFGVAEKFHAYRFISPWMALKEENHAKWVGMGNRERQVFLRHLLRENLKSISKGFLYRIPDIEAIEVDGMFDTMSVNFKNQEMICFSGRFYTNFHIPDFIGVGKQTARGFGVVVKEGENA